MPPPGEAEHVGLERLVVVVRGAPRPTARPPHTGSRSDHASTPGTRTRRRPPRAVRAPRPARCSASLLPRSVRQHARTRSGQHARGSTVYEGRRASSTRSAFASTQITPAATAAFATGAGSTPRAIRAAPRRTKPDASVAPTPAAIAGIPSDTAEAVVVARS